jgi:2,4-didehydro-3-deoxy-L-rhamnonate hydrolase
MRLCRFGKSHPGLVREGHIIDVTPVLDGLPGSEERSLRNSIDTYTALGPWLVTADELKDPSQLSLELSVNGEPRQKANTRDLIVDVPGLIAFATSFYTLMRGDVLLTGRLEGGRPHQGGRRHLVGNLGHR